MKNFKIYVPFILSLFVSLLLGYFMFTQDVIADTTDEETTEEENPSEGVALSGSFSNQNIKMVAGERYEPSNVTIIIFNNYSEVADFKLTQTVVDENNEPVEGIIFDMNFDEIIFIDAKSTYEFQVSFTVSEFMLPGKYKITIGAEVIPNQDKGIIAVPAVRQRANLEIFGEAGFVNFNVVDVFGNPFFGEINVFRRDGTRVSEVANFNGSSYQDRLVPGNYEVVIYYIFRDIFYEVLLETFTLENGDDLNFTYVVQTVFINNLNLSPILSDDNVLLNASISISFQNIYEVYDDVVIRMDVFYNGVFLETIDIQNISNLDLGSISYRYNYVPIDGWKNGTYSFELTAIKLGEEEIILATLDPYIIFIDTIPGEALPIWVIVVGSSIVVAFIASFIILLTKRQNDTDIICLDDDPAYLQALSSLIEGGKK